MYFPPIAIVRVDDKYSIIIPCHLSQLPQDTSCLGGQRIANCMPSRNSSFYNEIMECLDDVLVKPLARKT